MNDLPPFSGDDPTCPKCGFVGASTRFRSFGRCEHGSGMVLGFEPNERLHRECDRCDYAWDEATVEQPKEAGGCLCADLSHSPCSAKAKHPDGLCEECHQNAIAYRRCVTVEIVGGPVSGVFHTTAVLLSDEQPKEAG